MSAEGKIKVVEKNSQVSKSLPVWSGRLFFQEAAKRLKGTVARTPLMYNNNLSRKYGCDVYLKREDLRRPSGGALL